MEAGANIPPKEVKTIQKLAVICPICEDKIVDTSGDTAGEDSIECEGTCKTRLNSKCVSMSRAVFVKAQSSSIPFLCPHCRIAAQQDENYSLKETVGSLLS